MGDPWAIAQTKIGAGDHLIGARYGRCSEQLAMGHCLNRKWRWVLTKWRLGMGNHLNRDRGP